MIGVSKLGNAGQKKQKVTKGYLNRMLEWIERGMELQSLLDEALGQGEAEIDEVIKSDNRATIVRGLYRGQSVHFKHLHVTDPEASVDRAQAELQFLETHLTDGVNRVVHLVDAIPSHGILVLGTVMGKGVNEWTLNAELSERKRLFALSADWLQAVVALRSEHRRFRARKHVEWLPDPYHEILPEISQCLKQLRQDLFELAKQIEGQEILYGVGHGDFTTTNLMYDGSHMWGIDIQSAYMMPALGMAARFSLARDMWLNDDELSGYRPSRFAIGNDDGTAFRFFVGLEMHKSFAQWKNCTKPDRVLPAVEAYRAGWEPCA